MRPMIQPPLRRFLVAPVVLPVQILAKPVETVDLVEDVELEDVGVVASTPGFWGFDCGFGAFLAFDDGE